MRNGQANQSWRTLLLSLLMVQTPVRPCFTHAVAWLVAAEMKGQFCLRWKSTANGESSTHGHTLNPYHSERKFPRGGFSITASCPRLRPAGATQERPPPVRSWSERPPMGCEGP